MWSGGTDKLKPVNFRLAHAVHTHLPGDGSALQALVCSAICSEEGGTPKCGLNIGTSQNPSLQASGYPKEAKRVNTLVIHFGDRASRLNWLDQVWSLF